MVDHFLRDAFGVLSCPFWSTVLQCGAQLPIHTLNYWIVQQRVDSDSDSFYREFIAGNHREKIFCTNKFELKFY